jgi:predicted nucleic acid-binding protein
LIVYPDSSFLMSGYLMDQHSPTAIRRMATHPKVLVTPFHRAEMANAIYQQVFRNAISNPQAQFAFANFEQDCAAGIWTLVDLPEIAFASCVELTRRRAGTLGVRTLDTLHVAAAIELKAVRFWTFDERQARLAEAEGLTVG